MLLIIAVSAGMVGWGYGILQSALRPNIQVINVTVSPATNPMTTTWLDMGRVSNMGSFNYPSGVNMTGEYDLVFNNSIPDFESTFVNLTYTTHWPDYLWTSFTLLPYETKTVPVHVNAGQQLGGDFWITGGSGNGLYFRILAHTCTENVSFTFSLINTGSSDGFADVVFTIDNASAWSNKYFVPQGSTLPINGSVIINDCDEHTFNIVVQRQYKP
jgi:hypothetical protein